MRREGLWASPACAQLLSFHGINWLNELLPVFTHPTVPFPDQVFPDVYFQTNAKCFLKFLAETWRSFRR